jgi:predicted ATPase
MPTAENESRETRQDVPRIEYLRVKNYRALRDLELNPISPLTVFLGPNGSGKSTVFDVFAFLAECFAAGLRKAWDKRGRFKELRTRGSEGAIEFELKYRESNSATPITYHLAISEDSKGPFVSQEWLQWKRGLTKGRPFKFLDFESGSGKVVSGEYPDEHAERVKEELASREMIAVNTLGQFAKHPRVSALRNYISGWYLSYLTADSTRGVPEAGPQERLSNSADNLANVIQYLKEQHKGRLDEILAVLASRIPRLERVDADIMADGRLLLQIKDAPFDKPVLARFASDGTLKMLAYLTVLYDPDPPQLVGKAAERTQLMVTTHSPFFVNGLRPEEVWVLYRTEKGYTEGRRAADMHAIPHFMKEGAQLGQLWMENYFEVGDPLTASGGPRKTSKKLPSRRSKKE